MSGERFSTPASVDSHSPWWDVDMTTALYSSGGALQHASGGLIEGEPFVPHRDRISCDRML